MKFPFLKRLSESVSKIDHPSIDIQLVANEDVYVESDAFEQLFGLTDAARAIDDIDRLDPGFFGHVRPAIERIVLTPDFHKGSGIPVGTVIKARNIVFPQAPGNDICCGMRLLATDMPVHLLEPHWDAIKKSLRSLFFEGKRDIPMSPRQRDAVLRHGLIGLYDTSDDNAGTGIWSRYDKESQGEDLDRVHGSGVLATDRVFGFDKFIESSGNVDGRDPQIGCVGGGNHFVELQKVESILDGYAAMQWGISKGTLAIMIHAGSVGLGHAVGGHFMEEARRIFPTSVKAPRGGFHPLPLRGKHSGLTTFYLQSMANAANFAFANRLFLGLMAIRAIEEATGYQISSKLVYDAPHNLIFQDGDVCLHRKGATPAEGMKHGAYVGKPVIIPGSMGAASYLLSGQGNTALLESACHGAGRSLSRGKAAHVESKKFDNAVEKLRVVTPIDPESPRIKSRRDIMIKYRKRVMEEMPYAYKDIEPVIDSVEQAQIAKKVVRLAPLCTVKG